MTLIYLEKPFETKQNPLWFHDRGLSQTASGYGSKLATTRMIKIAGERIWRRVYVMIYSNIGTAYVVIKGQKVIVRDLE